MSAAFSPQDPRQIDAGLREKYDVRGPRYTSYPPATHFHPLKTAEVFARWQERNELTTDPGLSLYLHIPFCRKRCLFCGCHTVVGKKEAEIEDYLSALRHEIDLATEQVNPARPVHQLAVGGGTPNFLSAAQIQRLFSHLRGRWQLADEAELSVEINPRTATGEKIDALVEQGFNRFSLGIQDFSPAVLRTVRRDQGLMEVEEVLTRLRAQGIGSINFDLIYGLPGQDLAGCLSTADKVVQLRPDRIALYSYAHVPWIHAHQQALERAGLPEPDVKAALFLAMSDRFLSAGYEFIGMDHFALPDDPLAQALKNRSLRRNFMGYTTGRGLDLLGLGTSAISSIGSAYSQDDKDIGAYVQTLAQGQLPLVRGFLLSHDDLVRRELLLELFCNFHVDLAAWSQRFDLKAEDYLADDFARLEPLVQDGLLRLSPEAIEVTDTGRFFIRNICMAFDQYLEKDAGQRVYSRTV